MNEPICVIDVESEPDTMIVTPVVDLGELNVEQFDREFDDILRRLDRDDARHLVIDFSKTDSFGSRIASALRQAAKLSRDRLGRAALCGLSLDQMESLKKARLDRLWHVFLTREEALEAVRAKDLAKPDARPQDTVQEASEDSFPASDAPAWTSTNSVGGPTAENVT